MSDFDVNPNHRRTGAYFSLLEHARAKCACENIYFDEIYTLGDFKVSLSRMHLVGARTSRSKNVDSGELSIGEINVDATFKRARVYTETKKYLKNISLMDTRIAYFY